MLVGIAEDQLDAAGRRRVIAEDRPAAKPADLGGAAGERSDATGGKFEETCRHRIGVRLMDGAADGPGKIEEREIAAAPADL